MAFKYSSDFEKNVERLLEKSKSSPYYKLYLRSHLGGPGSREDIFEKKLYPEIVYHCGDLKGKTVLDFGTGTGATAVMLANECDHVCVHDIDNEALKICEQRLRERGLNKKIKIMRNTDFRKIPGSYDFILMNAVVEHIPLSEKGLRKEILRELFALLKPGGFLYINETPNRLWPYDGHTTKKWLIPWTKPGNKWALKKARGMGLYRGDETDTKKLENDGAWGATYFEIKKYLKGFNYHIINLDEGHDRHVYYTRKIPLIFQVFDFLNYILVVKLLRLPITTFWPNINNLVIQKPK